MGDPGLSGRFHIVMGRVVPGTCKRAEHQFSTDLI